MADPEQLYSEVLAEEQAKGSAAPVAEGRAKAARQRAHEGSPHPKEAKWWPGAQPQFEGGEAGSADGAEEEPAEEEEAPAAEAPAEEAPAAEAPAAEAPAAEAPAAEAAPAPAEPVAAPPELTRDQPEAPARPAATAPVTAGAAAATETAPAAAATATLPSGATHGTAAGNRLRPEDAVSTDAQFDAQAAMHQRRKMIDELVSTGVPAVAARSTERRSGGAGMLLLYLLIPLIAVFVLVNNQEELAGGSETPAGAEGGEGGEGGGLTITAANVQFDTDQLTIPADGGALRLVNDDTAEHNVAIYEDDSASTSAEIFKGQVIPGGQETTYEIPANKPGEYYFQCDVHPAMNGTATFE